MSSAHDELGQNKDVSKLILLCFEVNQLFLNSLCFPQNMVVYKMLQRHVTFLLVCLSGSIFVFFLLF